jgi:hypothetical protein
MNNTIYFNATNKAKWNYPKYAKYIATHTNKEFKQTDNHLMKFFRRIR